MGVSASSSNPQTSTQSAQLSTEGAAGANSPTLTSGGNIDYNDPALQLGTVQALASVITTALGGAGSVANAALTSLNDTQANVAQNSAAQTQDNNALLSQVLTAENQLAQYQGSGGAIQQSASTNYLIWGAIAIAALAVWAIFSRKS